MDFGYLNSYGSHRLPSPPALDDDLLFLHHFDDIIEANGHALDLARFFSSSSSSLSDGAASSSTMANGCRECILNRHLMVSNTSRCNSSFEASQDAASALIMAESPRHDDDDDDVQHDGERAYEEEEGDCGQAPENKCVPVKGQWTPEEDSKLRDLVERYGTKKWSLVSKSLNGRIGKQCRERWHNHLRPDIKTDAWTEEEDRIVIQGHREHGNRWVEIAKRLPGRTENSIKNHWNTNMRRQTSRRARRKPTGSSDAAPSTSTSTLLHDYIRSLDLPPPRSKKKSKTTNPPPPRPSADRNSNSGTGAPPRGRGFAGRSSSSSAAAAGAADEWIYGIGCLFQGLGTGAEVAATCADVVPQPQPQPQDVMVAPGDGEHGKGDMDLFEMINMFYEENRKGKP